MIKIIFKKSIIFIILLYYQKISFYLINIDIDNLIKK